MNYSNSFLKSLYTQMLRIRLCEESLVAPILNGEVRCPVHLYTGEEAIAVGVSAALRRNDCVFGTHRSHGHYLAKGGSVKKLIAEIFGKASGCSRGRGGSMHIIDTSKGVLGTAPIVAGTIPLSVGAALAFSIRKDPRVVVSFFGDGATGEGVLYESLNFAALKKLPIIFACENNQYSTHLPLRECRPANNIFETGIPFCIKGQRVDGNDVLAVYEASKTAVKSCRSGGGPLFLEFLTYRLRGHVGPDDNIQGTHIDIRPPLEINKWKRRDPIGRFERHLFKKQVLGIRDIEMIKSRIAKEIDAAYEFARKSPYPLIREVTKHVFKA